MNHSRWPDANLYQPWDDETMADMARLHSYLNIRLSRGAIEPNGSVLMAPEDIHQVVRVGNVTRARKRLLSLESRSGVALTLLEEQRGCNRCVRVYWPKFIEYQTAELKVKKIGMGGATRAIARAPDDPLPGLPNQPLLSPPIEIGSAGEAAKPVQSKIPNLKTGRRSSQTFPGSVLAFRFKDRVRAGERAAGVEVSTIVPTTLRNAAHLFLANTDPAFWDRVADHVVVSRQRGRLRSVAGLLLSKDAEQRFAELYEHPWGEEPTSPVASKSTPTFSQFCLEMCGTSNLFEGDPRLDTALRAYEAKYPKSGASAS